MKYILLDRDGTIIVDKHYLNDPEGVELFTNTAEGLKAMQNAGYKLLVTTNQSGIGRGYYSEKDMHAVNARMAELLAEHGIEFKAVYFCPHAPDQDCDCRKPAPGMFDQAIAEFGINPEECYVIGDKLCDVELGKARKAKSILVRTGKGLKEEPKCVGKADYIADDLLDAAEFIKRSTNE
ncbi:D-glycero-beta-D-manno-heptose 1,7-bisphosphate 7-phosphatase [Maridesulfovibrio salexigens]|uniref:D,D-heptose 1,7-bisphosphate phosphatase n=1 Tax=Maridesulfovibrio salexigens (strain ATCC 14822 / DSM 2638 / NCIMB 8403 / VKM B-1763) TaxID=526222 RepID=C6C0A7_MARSD|nr:D-glycero-beta-D-manno-heptose 1,7-bisphosphate 7-phosphatase [Maridesulfovibrio salexigens]ACS79041.1 hydrolase, HAD-superfamily, subfamily IIIA [Maridesulfovibrio salexigens DSM 2638]